MDALILLEKFRVLLAIAPPLEGRGPYGQEQFAWLGRASAIVATWDRSEVIFFRVAVDGMTGNFNRVANHGVVFTTMHKAIASLEDQLPRPSGQAFGPGAAYDFFRALRELVLSAEKRVFLIDPYMDAETFDGYLSAVVPGRDVRVLCAQRTFVWLRRNSRCSNNAKLKLERATRSMIESYLLTTRSAG